jgi:small subunit ribosomal protein S8
MVTDPIADMLVRIRNAAQRGYPTVKIPASRLKTEVLRVLHAEGFIGRYEREEVDGKPMLTVQLRYVREGQPVIAGLRRISKPGKRVYAGRRELKQVLNGMGLAILSTSRGVMTDHEARRASLGGEVLCQVW